MAIRSRPLWCLPAQQPPLSLLSPQPRSVPSSALSFLFLFSNCCVFTYILVFERLCSTVVWSWKLLPSPLHVMYDRYLCDKFPFMLLLLDLQCFDYVFIYILYCYFYWNDTLGKRFIFSPNLSWNVILFLYCWRHDFMLIR